MAATGSTRRRRASSKVVYSDGGIVRRKHVAPDTCSVGTRCLRSGANAEPVSLGHVGVAKGRLPVNGRKPVLEVAAWAELPLANDSPKEAGAGKHARNDDHDGYRLV